MLTPPPVPRACSCIISQLHYLPSQQRVAVLHDSLAALRATPQHSRLSVVDVASWREVAPGMADVLAGYELAAVAPAGPSGSELLASSVRLSGGCRRQCGLQHWLVCVTAWGFRSLPACVCLSHTCVVLWSIAPPCHLS